MWTGQRDHGERGQDTMRWWVGIGHHEGGAAVQGNGASTMKGGNPVPECLIRFVTALVTTLTSTQALEGIYTSIPGRVPTLD